MKFKNEKMKKDFNELNLKNEKMEKDFYDLKLKQKNLESLQKEFDELKNELLSQKKSS